MGWRIILLLGMVFAIQGCTTKPEKRNDNNRLFNLLDSQFNLDSLSLKTVVLIPNYGCDACVKNAVEWIETNKSSFDETCLFITSNQDYYSRFKKLNLLVVYDSTNFIDKLNFEIYNVTILYSIGTSRLNLKSVDVDEMDKINDIFRNIL